MLNPCKPDHGLNQQQVDLIIAIFRPYAEQIEKICLFGSRATGAYRPNSDIKPLAEP